MVAELDDANTGLDIPQHACHVSGTGDDLTVVEEPAAAEVAGVCAELTGTLNVVALLRVEIVDGADVVKTTTCHVVARG